MRDAFLKDFRFAIRQLRQRPGFTSVAVLVLTLGLLKSMLFGVGTADPITFFAVPLLLLLVVAIACILPALRATRINPTIALRSD